MGMGPKGTPLKSVSSPATMTRTPLLARVWQTSTRLSSKNWASSMPTTCTSPGRSRISDGDDTGVDSILWKSCETTSTSEYLRSIAGLNMAIF